MIDENSVQSQESADQLFASGGASLFGGGDAAAAPVEGGKEAEGDDEPELDANGNPILTREQILKNQSDLAASIAKKQQKRWYHYNPIDKVKERILRASIRERRQMLQREEGMKQDLERFLMELEERNSWLAYELNIRNYSRLVKEERIASSRRREMAKIEALKTEEDMETGLQFFRGNVRGYRRWQR